ncbi:MAG: hypothetical protein ACF8R7_15275 [Phycisphaerales bacterium JB039]
MPRHGRTFRDARRRLQGAASALLDGLEDRQIGAWLVSAWRALRRPDTAQRVLAPLALNAAVHGALLILLAIAWTQAAPRAAEPARDVVLSLDNAIFERRPPEPVPVPADDAALRAEAALQQAAAAIAQGPRSLPELTPIAPPAGALPELRARSGSGRDPAGLLRARDQRIIGSASFAGAEAEQADSVVYVVDASGAMITSLPMVIEELQRSIGALKPTQRFQIVLFRNRPAGAALEVFSDGAGRPALMRATERNKAAAFQWLASVRPLGASNPLDGLRRGLEFRPDVIFLLSRSIVRSGEGAAWGRGREAILDELDRLNPLSDPAAGQRRVQIKTIQFIDPDPSGVMEAIGDLHGGAGDAHIVLSLEELGARAGGR